MGFFDTVKKKVEQSEVAPAPSSLTVNNYDTANNRMPGSTVNTTIAGADPNRMAGTTVNAAQPTAPSIFRRNPAPVAPVQQPTTQPAGEWGTNPPAPRVAQNPNRQGNYQDFGQAWLASGGRTVDDLRRFIESNADYGAEMFGSKGDKVRIGGRAFDAVQAAGAGGRGGLWMDITNGGPTPAGRGSEFDDPWGANLEEMVRQRIAALSGNPASPNLDQFMAMLLEKEKANQARAGEFAGTLRARAGELQQDPYTDQQADVMRTKAMDALNRRRQDTLRNRREGLYARGFEPTSGLVVGEERDVNNTYDQASTQIDSDLLQNSIDEGFRRKNQAVDLEGLAQQALAGGDLASLSMMAQRAQMENEMYNRGEDRSREALTTAGLPLNLMDRRQQLAIQGLNAGQGGQDPFAAIMQMLQYGQQQNAFEQQGRNNNMQGFGQLAEILMNYFGNR